MAPGVPIAHARAKIHNSSTVHEIIIAESRIAIDFNAFLILYMPKCHKFQKTAKSRIDSG